MRRSAIAAGAVALGMFGCAAFGTSAGSPDAGAADPDAGAAAADGGADGAASGCPGKDLASDSANCGWCGHDCAGAVCAGGTCAPTKLAESPDNDTISGFAINSSTIFFSTTTAGAVLACPTTGCQGHAPAVLFASTSGGFDAIAADDANVYALDKTLSSCAASGCGGTPSVLATGVGYATATALLVDASAVYWVDGATGVYRCPKAGPCNPTRVSPANAGGSWLTQYDDALYWVEAASQIVRCDPTSCGSPATAASGVVNALAVGPGGVFWTDGQDDGTVSQQPLGGGQPSVFAKGQYRPAGVVTDGAVVYWYTNTASVAVIERAPVAGGAPAAVARNQDAPIRVLVDERWVYWANREAIWRAPK